MPSTIKNLKTPPLLTLPKEDRFQWARPTESDWAMMHEGLKRCRRERGVVSIAQMHYCMRELGRPQTKTSEDLQKMRNCLEDLRRTDKGEHIASVLFWLRRILPEGSNPTQPMPPVKNWRSIR